MEDTYTIIYAVTTGCGYEDYGIEAIFTTYDLAYSYAIRLTAKFGEDIYIDEYALNPKVLIMNCSHPLKRHELRLNQGY